MTLKLSRIVHGEPMARALREVLKAMDPEGFEATQSVVKELLEDLGSHEAKRGAAIAFAMLVAMMQAAEEQSGSRLRQMVLSQGLPLVLISFLTEPEIVEVAHGSGD